MLHDWIDSYMELTEETEPPEVFDRWTAISAVASALQRKCWLDRGIAHKLYPNMYIVLIGPAGVRKSTAMRVGRTLLEGLGLPITAESTTREALIDFMLSPNTRASFTYNDKEIRHASVTVHSEELMVFLGRGTSDNQFISDLTTWFDSPDIYRNDTMKRGQEKIYGVWFNLIGATTPELLKKCLSKIAIGGGLTSRMLFIYANKLKKYDPFPTVTTEQLNLYEKLQSDLLQILSMSGPFSMSQEFKDSYESWYEETNESPPDLGRGFPAYISRRATHFLKLCQIVSASRSDDMQLTQIDFERSNNYLSEAESCMPKVFEGYGEARSSNAISELLEYIILREKVTEQEIMREFIGDFPSRREIVGILVSLQAGGYLRIENKMGTYDVIALKRFKRSNEEKDSTDTK